MEADRQAFGSTREYFGAVVESVKRWGYFKGFEGHTEYSIKGSMCSLERKISSAKAWRSFRFITYSYITSLTTTWPLKPLWHYSLRNELGWVLSPCFQRSRDTFLSSCLVKDFLCFCLACGSIPCCCKWPCCLQKGEEVMCGGKGWDSGL